MIKAKNNNKSISLKICSIFFLKLLAVFYFSSFAVLQAAEIEKNSSETLMVLLAAAVMVFVIMLLVVFLLPRILSDEVVAKHVGSRSFRFIVLALTGMVFFIVLGLVWYTLEQNKQSAIERVEKDLKFVHRASNERLLDWIDDRKNYLMQLGRDQTLVALTQKLLALPADKSTLQSSQVQADLRDFFVSRQSQFGRVGFFIISPEKISIASRQDNSLGSKNLIAIQDPERLDIAFRGNPVFIPPIRSDVNIQSSTRNQGNLHDFNMFFAAPIQDMQGDVLAVLTQHLLPAGRLSKIMQYGSMGQSGESYLVNGQGGMISQSRFNQQLKQINLAAGNDSLLKLRDPGGNLLEGFKPQQTHDTLPLTIAAQGLKHQANNTELSSVEVVQLRRYYSQ